MKRLVALPLVAAHLLPLACLALADDYELKIGVQNRPPAILVSDQWSIFVCQT